MLLHFVETTRSVNFVPHFNGPRKTRHILFMTYFIANCLKVPPETKTSDKQSEY